MDEKKITRLDLDSTVQCEMCGWSGILRDCEYEKTVYSRTVQHTYRCPDCSGDIYNVTEDKPKEDPETKVE